MLIQSTNVWLDHQLKPAQILIEGSKIHSILPYDYKKPDFDYGNYWILPGFIDIHTHGISGINAVSVNEKEMQIWQQILSEEGVTAFVAALETQSEQDTMNSLERLSSFVHQGSGAELLGIFLEGYFINVNYCGAQNKVHIQKPSRVVLKQYIEAAHGHLIRLILAVEMDHNYEVLRYAVSKGIEVSAGHSAANYSQISEAVTRGLTSITHTYNAMSSFHHRETGLIGAALLNDSLYTEIIADGYHTCWEAVKLLSKNKDNEHLILVSDASSYKCYVGELPLNIYRDENQQIRTRDKGLAGSVLRINEGVHNLIRKADVSLVTAINAATENPARLLGLEHVKGSIRKCFDADLVVVTPDFNVVQTICRGKCMKEVI